MTAILPPKPKRRLPGIEIVWSRRLQDWCWRARREYTVDGRRIRRVGTLRRTQERAAADYVSMDVDRRIRRGLVVTLEDAIEHVIDAMHERGAAPATISTRRIASKFLLRYWKPDTRLEWLDEDEVLWFAREALADGASPNTIRGKYLPLLGHCFTAAELPNPVPGAVTKLARSSSLKTIPPRMQYLTVHEVGRLIERMRSEVFLDSAGRVLELPAREAHADLVALFATTGVRTLELSRVRLEDVDLARGEIHVRRAKDAANPRRLFAGDGLRPVLERMVRHAEAEHAAGRNPKRALIPNLRSQALNVFVRWGKRLGEPRLNGRCLRHTFVTAVLELGGSAYDARVLAGHRNLKTTDRYVTELQGRRPVLERLDAALAPGTAIRSEGVAS